MAIHPTFPSNPFEILDPVTRWVPGDVDIRDAGGREKLIPPLVHHIRNGVKRWRDKNYPGISATSRALLTHWFQTDHLIGQQLDQRESFKWYFAQQEAVESAIWLYEVMDCKESKNLLQFDASGQLMPLHFKEEWPRYVMKMATGSGKTKVLSLLLTWCYFHKLYENDSDLSTNFLIIAPNIIVLDRLKEDFENLKIFHNDPLLPQNGYMGKNWEDDFQPSLHIQDEIGAISPFGNIYLTNIHRLFLSQRQQPSADDPDSSDYFLGPKPVRRTLDSRMDLGILIRQIPDLVIFNDEAHHIHDERLAWAETIKELHEGLVEQGHRLSAQFDVTATPKHMNGSIFPHTISDYPLCEAIFQGVIKQPVIPDDASMAKLQEKTSDIFVECYEDHINLGYIEWRKISDIMEPLGKKAVLFIMTDQTQTCDEVREYMEKTYPDLIGSILVIHTKKDGSLDERDTRDLEDLRKASREIDSMESPYKVIISVMMLREGWDVQNVTTIVGLRPFKSASKILPEQTLGRGLRRMFRGKPISEEPKLSIIGTQAFIDFVKSIRSEGVDLDYKPMGKNTPPKGPMLVQIDAAKKNRQDLEIMLPLLTPRMHRDWKNLNDLKVEDLKFPKEPLRNFSEEEQQQIIFVDINTDQISHMTKLQKQFEPDYHRALHFFTQTIMRDLRLVGGMDILFGKLKDFISDRLFGQTVDLNDLNVLRNLSENSVRRTIIEIFKQAINNLTVTDKGTSEIKDMIRLSQTRSFQVKENEFIIPKKSMLTKIVGDNPFELEFARFLDACPDIISFIKNNNAVGLMLDYRNEEGSIANYYPDYIVKRTESEIWIIELKGREDLDTPHKRQRLEQYCKEATQHHKGPHIYKSLYIKQNDWEQYRPKDFEDLLRIYVA